LTQEKYSSFVSFLQVGYTSAKASRNTTKTFTKRLN